ncbi:glycoside hydrolase family 3 N-terminal domain-containing protein [Burkholderia pseudomallei]|uniref:glycoside hydrolase family 3 N-terminal domain-containing protein n=1 Tax=Burkholderia pseudomallei TaxID=28450 RepID=UPI001AD773FA|nr:glycoside hydrolase family 3 N-terminal domain-containing protein [Burkholderia pseudomallei]MBO7752390.1 hypothetical protein [Burkholderia pseudomallei]
MTAKMLLATLLLAPTFCVAATLPTADELRSLFVVENPPLTSEFGALLIRNQFDVRPLIACELRKAHPNALILTDQEGGAVRDMTHLTSPPAPWDVARMTPAEFSGQVKAAGEALANSCVDIDLAPVAETNSDRPQRSYSDDPREASIVAARFAKAMTSAGVTPVLKHYPGKLASCTPVALLPGFQLREGSKEVEVCPGAAASVWRMADAFPLHAAPIVMLSNRIYPSVSPLPAVLDPVYAQHLRAAGFKGLVISDAIWEISNRPVTVVQALKSVDIVLLPSPRQVNEAIPVILEALRTGQLNAADMRAKLDLVAGFKAAALARREPLLVDILH